MFNKKVNWDLVQVYLVYYHNIKNVRINDGNMSVSQYWKGQHKPWSSQQIQQALRGIGKLRWIGTFFGFIGFIGLPF